MKRKVFKKSIQWLVLSIALLTTPVIMLNDFSFNALPIVIVMFITWCTSVYLLNEYGRF